MKLLHLSHTDLDGYGCQYISSKFFGHKYLYNSNYGNEITSKLKLMFSKIEEEAGDGKKVFILINDLNLTTQDCKFIEQRITELRASTGLAIELKLLDHHVSGEEQAREFAWYELDTSRCATKMTYDFFGGSDWSSSRLVDAINAVDLWKEEKGAEFEFGKTLMRLITETKELNKLMFPSESADYKLKALEAAKEFLDSPDSHIALDDNIHFIKKEYLRAGGENNSIDNLASDFVTKLLGEKKDEFTVWYKNYQGFMTVSVGNVSVIANGFLSKNHEYDFFIDVSPKGNISLRSSNKADVCEIAKTVFNGGGHKNASGGRANNIKDFYTYSEYKKTIDEIFRKAEGI